MVQQNLLLAFPDRTDAERKQIEKAFYRNFTDNFIETIKMISGGGRYAKAHFTADMSLMEEYFNKSSRFQFHLGHHFNWEMANIAVSSISSPGCAGRMISVMSRLPAPTGSC